MLSPRRLVLPRRRLLHGNEARERRLDLRGRQVARRRVALGVVRARVRARVRVRARARARASPNPIPTLTLV